MKKLALTGAIGTGKSFISRMFIEDGIPVFYADDEAKKLYARADVLADVRKLFGDEVFDGDRLNFGRLGAIIFANAEKKAQLEALIHPLVMEAFNQWAAQQNADIVMMESAIIFEAHLESYFDKIIVVHASLPVRIKRIQRRNPELSEAEIMRRINAQLDQEIKCRMADEVIDHEEDI